MSPQAEGKLGPIVSSAHLAAGAMPSLSELEFGLILLGHAFERWMVGSALGSCQKSMLSTRGRSEAVGIL